MDSDIFKKELFDPALDAFRRIMVPFALSFGSRLDCVNCLPKTFQRHNPDFNEWFAKLSKDIYPKGEINNERYNKIKQYGNLLLAQPTGGFQIGNMNKQTMIDQYRKAVSGDKPVLMVITEPFQEDFVKGSGLLYQCLSTRDTQVGVLTNEAFRSAFTVTLGENTSGLARVAILNVTNGLTPITIANWHGDSKGKNIDAFKSLLQWAYVNKIDYITGDTNITSAKTDRSIASLLTESSYWYTCSAYLIEKSRVIYDIILNNQIEKGKAEPEVDGMVIIAMKQPKEADVQMNPTVLKAFSDYSETTPILADHCVVSLDVGFTLMSATGARMDDPTIGIFSKPEWMNVDLNTFHKNYGLPYTRKWAEIYNRFIMKNKQYADISNGVIKFLPSMTGGRTRRKTRRRRRTRHLR